MRLSNHNKRSTYPLVSKSLLLIALSSALVACGDDNSNQNTTSNDTSQTSNTSDVAKVELNSTPINLDDALYDGPPSFSKVEPCPFLTTETAKKAVNPLLPDIPFTLGASSNSECRWFFDKGISFQVSIKSKEKGESMIAHQMGYKNPPVVKSQAGPGTGAVAHYYKNRKDKLKKTPAQFIFTQDDRYIFIPAAFSFKPVSLAQLQNVADEISLLLPKAPVIKQRQREEIKKFNNCNIWKVSSLTGLLKTEKQIVPDMRSGAGQCMYLFPGKNSSYYTLSFNFSAGSKKSCEKSLERRGFKREKAYKQLVGSHQLFTDKEFSPEKVLDRYRVCLDKGEFNISIEGKGRPYAKQMKLLLENVLNRLPASK